MEANEKLERAVTPGDRGKREPVRDGKSGSEATLTEHALPSATWTLPWRRWMKPRDTHRSWFTEWLRPFDEPAPVPEPGGTSSDWLDVLRNMVVR